MVDACTKRQVKVKKSDLPLCCPMKGQSLWNAHPKIFLPIEDNGGQIRCPYCGTEYVLVDDK